MYVQCPLLLDTPLSDMEECAHMKRRFKESVAGGLDHLFHDHIDPTLRLLVSASRLTSGRHIGGMFIFRFVGRCMRVRAPWWPRDRG
jgi:hypothetical protein